MNDGEFHSMLLANQKYKACRNHFMTDFTIVGPVIGILAAVDVILHIRLDLKKVRTKTNFFLAEPSTEVPMTAVVTVAVSTLLSFFLVFLIPIAWLTGLGSNLFWFTFPILSPPVVMWMLGLMLLSLGIGLHYWSRSVRQEMAASWAMSKTHQLVTTGPYGRIRHPSYASYLLCFLGLFLLLPSVVSCLLFLGFPGYYILADSEELNLMNHFGDEYRAYMKKTGRFLPI
ncbi:MAG: isoprenylcysteine carboxylmethyltransferase family protein [Candidatus Thorarchaeota archaeon]|nr:isoprenylcysteine carboxylmethyltransferase family protein [Candidatus Thorarchaeota archaeon]